MTLAPASLLMVTHSLSRRAGGLFFAMPPLARHVAALGLPTTVAGLWDADFERDQQDWAPLAPRACRTRGPASLGHSPELLRVANAAAAAGALIHLHGLWKMTSRATLRARRRGAPVIISPHGMLDAWALRQSPLKKRLARLLYEDANLREASCIHVLCEAERRQVRDFGLRNPVAVIPNGVDVPAERAATPVDPCPEWQGRRVALFLSRLHKKKGLEELIAAFAVSESRAAGWALAIAGPDEGGYAAVLRRRIADAGAADIRLVGPQYGAQKDAWLRRADLFVLPSFSEGFPMALLEALAHGVPALITPACNFPEADQAGAAITATPEPASLAEGLRRVWALAPAERRAMGARGRALVAARYTWPTVAARMLAVYRWAGGAADRPACVRLD